jgi:chorismate dehydratase
MQGILRIGGLDGLNAAPLQWGLGENFIPGVELTLRSPAASAAALARGKAHVALIPTVELARQPGLEVVPGLCVAARRRVRSVVLITKVAPEALRRVSVDETSCTSVMLLRILLARRFGVRPAMEPCVAHLQTMMARSDGALLIADAALRAHTAGWQVHDLAELWATWTGLPFVFAVWAARPGTDMAQVEPLLRGARAEGLRHLPQLVAQHATRHGNPGGPALTAYLGELLHYSLGPEEEVSVRRFFAEAQALGLIPKPLTLPFAAPVGGDHRARAGERS